MTWARGSTTLPGGPDAGDAGAPGGVDGDPAVGVDVAAQADQQGVVRDEAGWHEQRVAGMTQPSRICTPRSWSSSSMTSWSMVPSTTPMARATQLGPLGGGEGVGWGEVDEVVGPLPDDLGVADGARGAADDAEPAVADLVAVAVGAVQDVAGPPVA